MSRPLVSYFYLFLGVLIFTLGCRTKGATVRGEMDGVYRASKDLQAGFAAGVTMRQLTDYKIRLDSELRIVDDKMRSNPSVRDRLQPYREAYFNGLQASDLAARVADYWLEMSACKGREPSFPSDREFKEKPLDEKIRVHTAQGEFFERLLACIEKYRKEESSLETISKNLNSGCKEVTNDDCFAKNAAKLLSSADSMLCGNQ
jgi:hypothetical protein